MGKLWSAYVCLLERAHIVGAVATHEAKQPTVLPTSTTTQLLSKRLLFNSYRRWRRLSSLKMAYC
jgi:hypothetical protein